MWAWFSVAAHNSVRKRKYPDEDSKGSDTQLLEKRDTQICGEALCAPLSSPRRETDGDTSVSEK